MVATPETPTDANPKTFLGLIVDHLLLVIQYCAFPKGDFVEFVLTEEIKAIIKETNILVIEPAVAFKARAENLFARLESALEADISTAELSLVSASMASKGKAFTLEDAQELRRICLEVAENRRLSLADFNTIYSFLENVSEYTR